MKKFIFKDANMNEMVLPVTPPSFEVSHGINIETINIHSVGDVILPGYTTLSTMRIDCMFPLRKYSFCQATVKKPYRYIDQLKRWCDNHTILIFSISDSNVNMQMIVSDISYGEKDGTGDVYATINLKEYRTLTAVKIDKTGNRSRASDRSNTGYKNYLIKKGDTLSAICRKYYGKASLYTKLANYNGIKNPNLIYAGKTLKLPDKNYLQGGVYGRIVHKK